MKKISTLMILGLMVSGSAFAEGAKKTGQSDSRECHQIATGQKPANDTTAVAQEESATGGSAAGSARDGARGVGAKPAPAPQKP